MILLSTLSSSFESFMQLIGVLLIFLAVLALTYITSKWIGGYQKQQYSNKNIKIVETFRIANNKYVQILELGEVYLVIVVCKDTVTTLAKLTKEELPNLVIPTGEPNSGQFAENFQEVFEKLKGLKNNKK